MGETPPNTSKRDGFHLSFQIIVRCGEFWGRTFSVQWHRVSVCVLSCQVHLWPAEEQVSRPGHPPAAASEDGRPDSGPQGGVWRLKPQSSLFVGLELSYIWKGKKSNFLPPGLKPTSKLFLNISEPSAFFFVQVYQSKCLIHGVCVSQGHIMAQGTYTELRRSGLDIVSLLRTDEEQDRLCRSADPDKMSLLSQRTVRSHSSHSSYSSLLPPEGSGTDDLPVGTF